jgi:GAF domain-containing protein
VELGGLRVALTHPGGGAPVLDRALEELAHRALSSDDPALFGLVDVARRAGDELAERARELRLVAATAASMAAAPDLDTALRALLGGLAALTDAEAGSVRLPRDADFEIGPCRVVRWRGGDVHGWHDAEIVAGSVSARVLTSGRGEYVPDLGAAAEAGVPGAASATHYGVRSTLVVPLHVAGRTIGTLHANAPSANAFDPTRLVPMQVLADYAAGAVAQARLRDAAEASARLDGALKTARMVGHELNNKLAIVSGYGDMLIERLGPGEQSHTALRMVEASDEAAQVLRRLQSIIRFEERTLGGVAFLDLDAATAQAHAC